MLRFLTAGESHGPSLTAILEGMPAGLSLTPADLQLDMQRRQKGYGSGGRMGIEQDVVHITGGVMGGQTTGGPIALHVENRDWINWRDKDVTPMTVPRPGHADLTGAIKYGYRDLRLALERASARETAARVAVGAVCRRFLAEFGIIIGSYVVAIGDVAATLPSPPDDTARRTYLARFEAAEANEVRCPDPEAAERMRQAIGEAMQAKDTLGGVFEVVALDVPPGLGSYVQWDRRLSTRLMGAVGSIQAVKGVEIGPAFENARLRGSQVHDEIFIAGDEDGSPLPPGGRGVGGEGLTRHTNHAGGLEGGITTGQPIVIRGAMKPIATTLTPLRSVDLASGESATTSYERSDFCAVPRAAVVGEAMVAFVLADALIEKLGGDSLAEMRSRFDALRRGRLDELPMDGTPWRFGYE
jgi:chorismate synthase